MAEIVPITVALYGFVAEQESIMQSAFDRADKWSPPWIVIKSMNEARVIIVNITSEDDYEEIEKLERTLPTAEIVVFSSKKPPQAKWHLERRPNGTASIVGFSQLVLKISHSLKRNLTEALKPKTEALASLAQPNLIPETGRSSIPDEEDIEQESGDFMSFFNTLDSVMDSKPHEKRKRFNES